MSAPDSPSEKPIDPPPETDVEDSYYHLLGVRSKDSSAEWLVNDASKAAAVVRSRADIFFKSGGTTQMVSSSLFHKTDNLNTQFFGEVERQVVGDQNVVIGWDNKIHVNGSQTVNVVKDHLINIAGKQTVQVGQGQTVTVVGDRKLDVQSNGIEITVNGANNIYISGETSETFNKKRQVFHSAKAEETTMGGYLALKASSEFSLTAAAKATTTVAGEATGTIGLMFKAAYSVGTETNYGYKNDICLAIVNEFNSGGVKDGTTSGKHISLGTQMKKVAMLEKKVKLLRDNKKKVTKKAQAALIG
jgi:hypothetical protein